jgi:hypothetical protein
MNNMSFHLVARGRAAAAERAVVDTAWVVLEAANELGDEAAVSACRRIIDASLNGNAPAPSDLQMVTDYFR